MAIPNLTCGFNTGPCVHVYVTLELWALVLCVDMHYYYREEAYKARVQLAVMDHNFHLGREQRTSPSVPDRCQYRRVYRKSSQNWDAVPVLEKKSYAYLAPLCISVFERYQAFDGNLKDKISKFANHPEMIASTIACTEPPPTLSIIQNKQSRFQNK